MSKQHNCPKKYPLSPQIVPDGDEKWYLEVPK